MEMMIKGDGWNKDNSAIADLVAVLASAKALHYDVYNCSVESTYGTPEELRDEVSYLLDRLQDAYQMVAEAIADGKGGEVDPEFEE
ncbi:MAG: hypothetical protein LC650_02445 [Actinobacteria bacterium]|nr:hypothetical protein [Actinomycetota bacterium]